MSATPPPLLCLQFYSSIYIYRICALFTQARVQGGGGAQEACPPPSTNWKAKKRLSDFAPPPYEFLDTRLLPHLPYHLCLNSFVTLIYPWLYLFLFTKSLTRLTIIPPRNGVSRNSFRGGGGLKIFLEAKPRVC